MSSDERKVDREFVDALREVLGLAPLYKADDGPSIPHIYPVPGYNSRTNPRARSW